MADEKPNEKSKNPSRIQKTLPAWWKVAFVSISVLGTLASLIGLGLSLDHLLRAASTAAEIPSSPTPDPKVVAKDLRGLPRESERHFYPVGVMIDNLEPARPQAGLQHASVVYETLVEGSATRFLAIIERDDLDRIGPVRSARPYYLAWAAEYGALYVHAGGSPEALTDVKKLGLHDLNALLGGSRYFWRDTGRMAPHNLYTKDELLSYALRDVGLEDVKTPEPWWTFDEASPTGDPATEIRVEFVKALSRLASFTYDPEAKTYIRSTAGKLHIDELTNEPVRVRNVIVEKIPKITAIGEKGRLSLEVTGEGEVLIFRNGVVLEGKWVKTETQSKTIFVDAAGAAIPLAPGNTWIEVAPEGVGVTYQ